MSTSQSQQRTVRVEATSEVNGPAASVYGLIADYRRGHTRIVPPRYFRNLEVEEGGYGDGTLIHYDLLAFGTTRRARARVTEPEPGRVLVETDLGIGAVTTFIVDPLGTTRSRVTIATVLPARGGIAGWLERTVSRSFMRKVYAAELARIDQVVQEEPAAASTA